jgi:hypothetical protein
LEPQAKCRDSVAPGTTVPDLRAASLPVAGATVMADFCFYAA